VNLSVIGCGYLGAVHAACMAKVGHHVVGIDTDKAKVDALAAGGPRSTSPDSPRCSRRRWPPDA
jgi:UDPglucose 6-dehydrogenase